MNVFQGEGGVFNKLLYIDGVGIKTWLKKVHSGWDTGGDFEIKIYKINNFLCFISCRRYSVRNIML